MAVRNGNGNGTNGDNGDRTDNAPVTRNTISKTAPHYTSAAAHADASRQFARLAAHHAGEAARLSRGKSR